MDIYGNKVHVQGPEINTAVSRRIATLVAYDMSDDDIVEAIPVTVATPSRWVRFMARMIREGRYVPKRANVLEAQAENLDMT